MKYSLLSLLFILLANSLQAQTSEQYSFKFQGIYGHILPHDKHVTLLVENPVKGAELSIEFQTMGEKPWQQFNAFPIIGLGTVWLDLGNPQRLGNAFAVYPYISFPLIRSRYFNLNLKAGAGASYLTKNYKNTNKNSHGEILPFDSTNTAIGFPLNVYFSGGGSLEIPISKGLSLTAEYTWNHMSDGSAVVPNSGLNLLNGFLGVKYFPNYKKFNFPSKQILNEIPHKFTFEVIASGGFRQLYYLDNKTYPIASLVFSAYRPISNNYRMGLGIDAFYDGVYDGTSLYTRNYITTNELKNKLRVGTSWQHELMLGRLTAGIDFGIYLYDPLKNTAPYADAKSGNLNKPLIYPYNITYEDGWFYTRAKLKYALDNHLFLSLGLKTHLQKAEFIEWGLGYRF
ncbi:MAG: acyloxyacyl hydrolase [Bacteroidota bacterium]|nr:acyloxyacyl hydrolase [Bacteroidota bacterium]